MTVHTYHSQMSNLVTHALLHLMFQIQGSSRFVPVEKRNAILKKYLKPMVKDYRYKEIKQDIKRLILLDKQKNASIENHLWKLLSIVQKQSEKFTHADQLYILFNDLAQRQNIQSQAVKDADMDFENDVIYMSESEIQDGFDSNNTQIRPLEFKIKTSHPDKVIEAIKSHQANSFDAECVSYKDGLASFMLSRS